MILILYTVLAIFFFAIVAYLFWILTFGQNFKHSAPVIAYHHIEKKNGIIATKIRRRKFEEQMLTLKEDNYRTLTPDEYINMNGKRDGKSIFITFDDAYKSVYKNALSILSSCEFKSTIFVISDFIGHNNSWDVSLFLSENMSEDELNLAIQKGCTIGSHSKTHKDLTTLSDTELENELLNSKKDLEEKFGAPVNFFAYPFGRYNKRVKEAVKKAGYKAAFTINRPLFQRKFDPFAIPVSGIYATDSKRNFLSKINRDKYVWIEDIKDKITNRFGSGTILVKGGKKA